jgi:hypothetical protein
LVWIGVRTKFTRAASVQSGAQKAISSAQRSGSGLFEQVDARPEPTHLEAEVQKAELAQAKRLVVEGPKRMGWIEADLYGRR